MYIPFKPSIFKGPLLLVSGRIPHFSPATWSIHPLKFYFVGVFSWRMKNLITTTWTKYYVPLIISDQFLIVFLFVFALLVYLCRPPLVGTTWKFTTLESFRMPVAVVAVCCVAVVCLGKRKTPFSRGLGRISDSHSLEVLGHHFSYVGFKRTTICLINQGLSSIQKRKHHFEMVVDLQGSGQIRCLGKMENTWRVWRCTYIFHYIFCSKTERSSHHTHHIIPQKFTHHT